MAGIDKSWMKIKNREDSRYEEGVAKFLKFVFHKKRLSFKHRQNSELIQCLCQNYVLRVKLTRTDVETHLKIDGVWLRYTNWVCHGEAPLVDTVFVERTKIEDQLHAEPTVDMLHEL